VPNLLPVNGLVLKKGLRLLMILINGHSVKTKCFSHLSFLGGNCGDKIRVARRVIKGL
jgi:hypothetical protein